MVMSKPRIDVILPFDFWVATDEFSNVLPESGSCGITHVTIEILSEGHPVFPPSTSALQLQQISLLSPSSAPQLSDRPSYDDSLQYGGSLSVQKGYALVLQRTTFFLSPNGD